MDDWFDAFAAGFLNDDDGCPDDPWTHKRVCPHCLAKLLRDVVVIASERTLPVNKADG